MNRLCIFPVFSEDGKLDSSTLYLLNHVKTLFRKIVFVVNGELEEMGTAALCGFSDCVFFRPNEGYDAGAWQYALLHLLSQEELQEYDELFFLNDTCFGPVGSIDKAVEEMENRNLDLWGLTEYHLDEIPYNHIQSFFLCFSKHLFSSDVFWKYWEETEFNVHSKSFLIATFELELTHYFEERGFRTGAFSSDCGHSLYSNPIRFLEEGVPFVKKKSFNPSGHYITSAEYRKLMKRLSEIGYPVSVIREYMQKKKWDEGAFAEELPTPEQHKATEEVLKWVKKFDRVLFYGDTTEGSYIIRKADVKDKAFVISDGCYATDHIGEFPVIPASRVADDDSGLVIMLRPRHWKSITPVLQEKGIPSENIFYYWNGNEQD